MFKYFWMFVLAGIILYIVGKGIWEVVVNRNPEILYIIIFATIAGLTIGSLCEYLGG